MRNGIEESIQDTLFFNPNDFDNDLAPWLMSSFKWGTTLGAGVELTYSFSDEDSPYMNGYPDYDGGVFGLSAQQKAMAKVAIDNYAAVADIVFSKTDESPTLVGDIRFANTDDNDLDTAYAFYPSDSGEGGDIWFGSIKHNYQNPEPGNYAYLTLIHELGHAVGLQHPHDDINPPESRHALKFTVMSYRDHVGDKTGDSYETDFFPTTLMMDDIIALQAMYGANYSTNADDTTYSWDADQIIYETLWDGGGNDTIDASNMGREVAINLKDGAFSTIGEAFFNGEADVRDCLGIAFNCEIENATGTDYGDTLTGNELDNTLIGNRGQDIINGRKGNDTLIGNRHSDTFRFDTALNESTNVDTVMMKAGSDNITLENQIFAGLAAGALDAANFRASSNGNAADSNDFILYNTTNGRLFYDSDGNGAGIKILFAAVGISTHPALTAADFNVT